MANIDILAVTILAINAVVFYLVLQMTKIGNIRGGALSGWFSSFIGIWVLVDNGKISTFELKESTFIFIYAIIAMICLLLVFVGKDNPSKYNKPILGDLLYYTPRIGAFMGVIVAAISQILA